MCYLLTIDLHNTYIRIIRRSGRLSVVFSLCVQLFLLVEQRGKTAAWRLIDGFLLDTILLIQ